MCLVELQKISHDRSELITRGIQPCLWLLVFGVTFSRLDAIPTGTDVPYLDFLAPGILAQSALFVSIFGTVGTVAASTASTGASLAVQSA